MDQPPVAEHPLEKPRRLDDVVQRTQQAVLASVEQILKRQMEPALDHARQTILATVQEIAEKHANSLMIRLKGLTLETTDEMLRRQIEPFLARSREMVLEGLENAPFVQRYADAVVAGLKKFLTETVGEVLPAYSRRVGKGLVGFALTATLCCLAAVFVIIGGIVGLQQLGLAPFASYLVGGAAAGLAGFCLLKINAPGPPGSP